MWAPFMEDITVDYDKEINHEYTNEIVCPFCGYEFGDSWEVDGNSEDMGLVDCEDCYKSFYAYRDISVSYCTEKAKYGTCNLCKAEDVVVEDYKSYIGNYEGLCVKCGDSERKRLRRDYTTKLVL